MSKIPHNIKSLAKAEGFPDVTYLGKWKERDIYSAYNKDFPYIGVPQYIIANESSIEWATLEQTEELMKYQF